MATDIAFAVGVVTLLGTPVPLAAKIFLLTLAVADDIGAIVVIAIFYTGALAWGWLAVAPASASAVIFAHAPQRRAVPRALPGRRRVLWLALLESGVHATLAGVALGLLTPAWPLRSPRRFPAEARQLIDRIEARLLRPRAHPGGVRGERAAHRRGRPPRHVRQPARSSGSSVPCPRGSPTSSSRSSPSPTPAWPSPATRSAASSPTLSRSASRSASWSARPSASSARACIAVRLGIGRLPAGTTWRHIFGLSLCAGIGFTVALFVTSISLTDPAADSAKIGILGGSLGAGVMGYAFLAAVPRADRRTDGSHIPEVSPRVDRRTTPPR